LEIRGNDRAPVPWQRDALARAAASGWLVLHESGTYVQFTPAGAEMFT
jgi:hypothetical protein